MRVDSAIIAVVVAFLLPLRLLSFVVRLNTSGSAGDLRRSCTAFAIAAALLAVIFALPRDHIGRTGHCVASVTNTEEVRLEIEQLKLQLNRLESFWENNSKASDDKGHASEEDVEVVKAIGLDIQALIKEQENIKFKQMPCSLRAAISDNLRVGRGRATGGTGAGVLVLAAESRKMNSDIYNIWSLANDTEKTVEALHSDVKKVQVLTDESRKLGSSIHQVWSLAKDTGKKVEALYADIEKVQIVSDMSRKMESNMHKMWSYAKQTEKRVEDLYSDVKTGFKKNGPKIPFWTN
ncbi:hypothetical protein ACQ4PT_031616 [Festuca glaucescens]